MAYSDDEITREGTVCWHTNILDAVMDPDALQTPDYYFLATHVRRPLREVERNNPRADRGSMTPEELLKRFLDPLRHHVQFVVVGESGSGKSHLIRWVSLHIPKSQRSRVILVKKANTNLQSILKDVLSDLDGPEFDEYRRKLKEGDNYLTPAQAERELLHQIILMIGVDSPHKDEVVADTNEAQVRHNLMVDLPILLQDPEFQEQFLQRTTIISDLTRHALGGESGRYDRRENDLGFRESDFDFSQWQVNPQDFSNRARRPFSQLIEQPNRRRYAANWVNRNLRDALGRLWRFSATDLSQLFLDVRRALHARNQELILLVEDFHRMQGIDLALLDALSVRPGAEYCPIRSLIAMTTGYYQDADDTLHTRTELVVTVGGQNDQQDRDDLETLSALYLNAARHKQGDVQTWGANALQMAREQQQAPAPLESYCDNCLRREPCHAAFGEKAGMGLYPFNATALRRVYDAAEKTDDSFDPRALLHLLNETLRLEEGTIRRREFPDANCVKRFVKTLRMIPLREQELRQRTGAKADLYRQIIELYGEPDGRSVLDSVPDAIYQELGVQPLRSFRLQPQVSTPPFVPSRTGFIPIPGQSNLSPPPIAAPLVAHPVESALTTSVPNMTVPVNISPIPPTSAPTTDTTTLLIEELTDWKNGNRQLSQNTVNELRKQLLIVVQSGLPWDNLFINQTYHAGSKNDCPLQTTSFYFEEQELKQKASAPIQILIPRTRALGLQALQNYRAYKKWDFPEVQFYLPAYAEMVDWLCEFVVEQIQTPKNNAVWNPVRTAVEVLASTRLLLGKSTERPTDLWEPLDGAQQIVDLSPDTKSILERTIKNITNIQHLLLARVGCYKGGGEPNKAQMLDAALLIPIIRACTTSNVHASIPDNVLSTYLPLADSHRQLRQKLLAECRIQEDTVRSLVEKIQVAIGDGSLSDMVIILQELLNTADAEGSVSITGSSWREYDSLLKRLEPEKSQIFIKEFVTLLASEESLSSRQYQLFTPENRKILTNWQTALNNAETLIDQVDRTLHQQVDSPPPPRNYPIDQMVSQLITTFEKAQKEAA